MLSYWLLFGSAFLAATVFPFFSEAQLVALVTAGKPAWVLWFFATAGNTLGAVVNWMLGRYLLRFEHRRWFPFKDGKLHYAQDWFQRYGVWSLLFAWLPVGGDALTFVAGVMRVNFWVFFILTALGKGLRYWVVILLTLGVLKF